ARLRRQRVRPDLTAERFLPNPLAAAPGTRTYRSGDLGSAVPDGELRYLGRADDQLKVRGYRIEPGEIEAALREHPTVRECAVVERELQLVAYVVGEGAPDELGEFLRARLPEHMVPAAFVTV